MDQLNRRGCVKIFLLAIKISLKVTEHVALPLVFGMECKFLQSFRMNGHTNRSLRSVYVLLTPG